jgi:hypothetical protein
VSLGFDKNDKTTTELAKYIIRMRFINLNFNDIIDKTENEVLGLFNKIS